MRLEFIMNNLPNLSTSSTPLSFTHLESFQAMVDERTRVLVLGSFPGVKSLQKNQYYAHPQNHFWKIIESLWPHECYDTYEDKCSTLKKLGIGLWDVYQSCQREGSLDSQIKNAKLNDFSLLLTRCPELSSIIHNGKTSFKHSALVEATLKTPTFYCAPSTSPANASWSLERKKAAWAEIFIDSGLSPVIATPSKTLT